MNKTFCLLAAVLVLASSFQINTIQQNLNDKCCTSCSLPQVKYVSLRNDKCGEACIDPKDYNKIKIFEPTLVLADTNTPCADQRYITYNGTVSHGIGSLKATLDMYLWGGF
jgi:hypothetical protein